MEIERRFLITHVPDSVATRGGEVIEQGYLSAGGGPAEVRVRRRGETTVLTVKSIGGLERREVELPIDARTFENLWPLTAGRRIRKRRIVLDEGGKTVELDVYEGALSGLVTAEVEFDSADDAEAFAPPGWFGEEVTENPSYRNEALALNGLPPGFEKPAGAVETKPGTGQPVRSPANP